MPKQLTLPIDPPHDPKLGERIRRVWRQHKRLRRTMTLEQALADPIYGRALMLHAGVHRRSAS